ncbi:MAG: hypothetical protein KKD31_07690 [Bacteroidetes bacterium]|nr:hypothetical protein [Bacteroidota bacterium]
MERIPTANAGAAFSSTVVECPNCKKEQRVYADIDGNELVIDFSDMEELVLVV